MSNKYLSCIINELVNEDQSSFRVDSEKIRPERRCVPRSVARVRELQPTQGLSSRLAAIRRHSATHRITLDTGSTTGTAGRGTRVQHGAPRPPADALPVHALSKSPSAPARRLGRRPPLGQAREIGIAHARREKGTVRRLPLLAEGTGRIHRARRS